MSSTSYQYGGSGTGHSHGSLAKGEVLAGGYDPEKRRAQVMSILETWKVKIEKMDFREEISEGGSSSSVGTSRGRGRGRINQPQDIVAMQLSKLEDDIEGLRKDVDAYTGPHFTRAYRTAQGLCSKLQTELDALDVTGREDIRGHRKKALVAIDELAKELASKAHANGRSCDDCEVKN